MSTKFENVTMVYSRGRFEVEGSGPQDGFGKTGPVTFYYETNGRWTSFGQGQCGSHGHHEPSEIIAQIPNQYLPKGAAQVVVSFTDEGMPPNSSSSDPQSVRFPD